MSLFLKYPNWKYATKKETGREESITLHTRTRDTHDKPAQDRTRESHEFTNAARPHSFIRGRFLLPSSLRLHPSAFILSTASAHSLGEASISTVSLQNPTSRSGGRNRKQRNYKVITLQPAYNPMQDKQPYVSGWICANHYRFSADLSASRLRTPSGSGSTCPALGPCHDARRFVNGRGCLYGSPA